MEDVMAEHRIETSIEVDATPARIWAILTDFAAMPVWNPFIKSISGALVEDGRLSVKIAPSGKSGMSFKPIVLSVRPEKELRWRGQLLFPGLFDGEHYFQLEPTGKGQTRFKQGEDFSGILVGLFGGALAATEAGFHAMNMALKQRAEAAAGHGA
jgi:hypothetical protein